MIYDSTKLIQIEQNQILDKISAMKTKITEKLLKNPKLMIFKHNQMNPETNETTTQISASATFRMKFGIQYLHKYK